MALVVTDSGPFVVALGPIKAEVAQVSSVDDADTYTTRLQRPVFGFFVPNNDSNAPIESVNLAFSGKTVTFNNDALSAHAGVVVLFGF
jgi:hypothetical protein